MALSLAAFCLAAILGLLSVGLQNNRSSVQELQSASIIGLVSADLYNTNQGNILASTNGSTTVSSTSKILGIEMNGSGSQSFYFDNNACLQSSANAPDHASMYRVVVSGTETTLAGSGSTALTASSFDIRVIWPATGTQRGIVESNLTLSANPNP